jgi:precorrin-2/cobalt-factor-2 C20-methyltransferase
MRGIAYGVGVGPGDPELMTYKAAKLIRENDVIAVPGKDPREAVAYKIAAGVVPEIADKELVPICMPMIKDRELIDREHQKAARLVEDILDTGRNLVYITLGDPTIYCTFTYIQHYLEADGYQVELVPGISSFCAAAARLGLPLVEWDQQLHVLPAVHNLDQPLEQPGTYVLMKSASRMKAVKEMLRRSGRKVQMVENCGLENEKLYRSLDEIPDDAGYFSLIIAKES